jgi:hypothetical protein
MMLGSFWVSPPVSTESFLGFVVQENRKSKMRGKRRLQFFMVIFFGNKDAVAIVFIILGWLP